MFINEDIVAVIFRLINFMGVIGVGFFFFKKYIAADIWHKITQKKDARQALCNQQATLEKRQCALDALLKEESLLCEQFRTKIDEWKNATTHESAVHEKKHAEHKAIILQKITQRALHKEHNRVQTIMIDTLAPELQESLSCYFKHEKQGAEYLNAIIHFMDTQT